MPRQGKKKSGLNSANKASIQASRSSQGARGGNGSGKGVHENKVSQESNSSTPRGLSRGVTPKALFSQGLQPKSPNNRAHEASNSTTGDKCDIIDVDSETAKGGALSQLHKRVHQRSDGKQL